MFVLWELRFWFTSCAYVVGIVFVSLVLCLCCGNCVFVSSFVFVLCELCLCFVLIGHRSKEIIFSLLL